MQITINGKTYNARRDPQSGKIEAEFNVDLDHDGKVDEEKTVWVDIRTGFTHLTDVKGTKTVLHIDDINGQLVGHSGQMVKMPDGGKVEIYKNLDGSWGTSREDIKPEDFVFDQTNPQPPYGLTKEQLPADADLDIFGVEYEYEYGQKE